MSRLTASRRRRRARAGRLQLGHAAGKDACEPCRGRRSGGWRRRRFDAERAFRAELRLLSRVNHRNLLQLLGFCEERGERILVFEFMLSMARFTTTSTATAAMAHLSRLSMHNASGRGTT